MVNHGSGDGEFLNPTDVELDSLGNILVVDSFNERVQKFDKNGNFIMKFGKSGIGNGEFNTPFELAIDSSDNIFVVDNNNNRVQVFNSDGGYTFLNLAIKEAFLKVFKIRLVLQ